MVEMHADLIGEVQGNAAEDGAVACLHVVHLYLFAHNIQCSSRARKERCFPQRSVEKYTRLISRILLQLGYHCSWTYLNRSFSAKFYSENVSVETNKCQRMI